MKYNRLTYSAIETLNEFQSHVITAVEPQLETLKLCRLGIPYKSIYDKRDTFYSNM